MRDEMARSRSPFAGHALARVAPIAWAMLMLACNGQVAAPDDAGNVDGGTDGEPIDDASPFDADAPPACDGGMIDIGGADVAIDADETKGGGPRTLGAGQGFTCALESGGAVLCWGDNRHGELGDGTTKDHALPAPVLVAPGGAPLVGVTEISVGQTHVCALKDDHTLWCWGSNFDGELGDGTKTNRSSPTLIELAAGVPLNGVAQVTADEGTCVRRFDGTVYCWGRNDHGSVGVGAAAPTMPIEFESPQSVRVGLGCGPLDGVVEITAASGLTNCARTSGSVLCWGFNILGEVGDDSVGQLRPSPTLVRMAGGEPLAGVTALAPGATCARTGDTALCWGYEWPGDGTTVSVDPPAAHVTPTRVLVSAGGPPLTGIVALAGGGADACALLVDATLRCWGWNYNGQLGDGTFESRPSPTRVVMSAGGAPLTDVVEVAPGGWHTCARQAGGAIYCWGLDSSGQIGDGTVRTDVNGVPPTRVKLP